VKQQKFIFFPLSWLLAHVSRSVEIAKVLRERGHEVVFAGENPDHPRSKLGIARDAGFRIAYAREPDHPYAWDRFVRYGWLISGWDLLWHQQWAPLDAILDSQVQLIQQEQPSMVIGDGTISVSTAGHIAGIPAAGIMNRYGSQFEARGSIFRPMIHAWDRLRLAPIRKRVYKKYGVAPVNALELLRSIPLLSPDLEELDHPAPDWPNWHSVGPILAEPQVPLPDWYDELGDGTPNIYITMGSTGLLDPVLRRSYAALGQMPYRFVLTTGGQVTPETQAAAPANFRFARLAPGSKLMERCEALVFHGGNGTMYQALAAGLPTIALPSHLEQEICADTAVAKGFGLKLSPRRVNGARLREMIERILVEPGFRAAAQRYRAAVNASNGPAKAADILEAAAKDGKPAGGDL
jgi:UDP:flavonoid glycosyltransferase YjiC (YdhE family)